MLHVHASRPRANNATSCLSVELAELAQCLSNHLLAGLELDPSNAQMKQGLSDARAAAAPPPPRPSGPTTSFSPYSSAPLARQPGPSGELVLMLAHLVLIVSAVLTVQPLSRRLSWQAYFLFCRTALVAGAYKVRRVPQCGCSAC